tara:strand:+ start:1048 stop:1308 length:261 start_codon:yes stop_codon:yes gene_type:complete
MSKKKSYMNVKNILTEGALKSFLLGLFKGKKGLNKTVAKHKIKLEKSVKAYNDATEKFEKAFEKEYGKKVKFERETIDTFIDKAKL